MRWDEAVRRLSRSAAFLFGSFAVAASAHADLFQAPVRLKSEGRVVRVDVADFDGNGRPDVIGVSVQGENSGSEQYRLSVFLGNGAGTFAPAVTTAVAHRIEAISCRDLDGDGYADVVASGLGHVTVLWADGSGGFSEQWPIDPPGASHLDSSVIADVDGDGRPDIVLSDHDRDEIVVMRVLPSLGSHASFGPPLRAAAGNLPQGLRAADMNGDGRRDLVLANHDGLGGPQMVRVVYGDGKGAFPTSASLNLPPARWPNALALGDLTGDGRPDVVVASGLANTTAWPGSLSVLANTGGGLRLAFDMELASPPTSVALADVNGDGRLDVVAGLSDAGTVAVLLGNGNGTLITPPTFPAASDHNGQLTMTDFDGDAQADIVSGGGDSSDLAVLLHDVALKIDAGPDVLTTAAGQVGGVTLTAAVLSPHTDVTFSWMEGSQLLALGGATTLRISLGIGTHVIGVEGMARDGSFARDTVTVTVAAALPPATQQSLDDLHGLVQALGDPAQQQTLAGVRDDVARVTGGVANQAILVGALSTFVEGRLDVTAGSRVSSQELAAAVADLKAAGLKSPGLDALGARIGAAVTGARKDLMREAIEKALARGDAVALFMAPGSSGGLLEVVRAVVADTRVRFPPSSPRDRRLVQDRLEDAEAAMAGARYATAYRHFATVYQALVR